MKSIEFNFPIYRDGQEVRRLLWEKGNTVETVVLLSKGEVDSKKIRVEFSLEDMDMSEFQDGATYTQIKDYVLEHSGLNGTAVSLPMDTNWKTETLSLQRMKWKLSE